MGLSIRSRGRVERGYGVPLARWFIMGVVRGLKLFSMNCGRRLVREQESLSIKSVLCRGMATQCSVRLLWVRELELAVKAIGSIVETPIALDFLHNDNPIFNAAGVAADLGLRGHA